MHYPTVSIVNIVNKSEQRDMRCDTQCVMSEVEYFDWLKKTTCQSGFFNWIIYSKVLMSCGCHSFSKTGFVLTYNIAVYLYLLFGHCYALFGRLLRELDNKYRYWYSMFTWRLTVSYNYVCLYVTLWSIFYTHYLLWRCFENKQFL